MINFLKHIKKGKKSSKQPEETVYTGTKLRMTADFSLETIQERQVEQHLEI